MTAEGTVGAPTCYFINPIPRNPGPISPGMREWQNRQDPGISGTGNPENETLHVTLNKKKKLLFFYILCVCLQRFNN
jgi:hypothetical protein